MAERDSELVSAINELDDRSFLSLCFGPSVSIRIWLLINAERFQIRPSLLLTVFLGFTKDPYPYVRKAALDGLAGLGNTVVEDGSMIECCYFRAIELLNDVEDCVRSAAVRVVRYSFCDISPLSLFFYNIKNLIKQFRFGSMSQFLKIHSP